MMRIIVGFVKWPGNIPMKLDIIKAKKTGMNHAGCR